MYLAAGVRVDPRGWRGPGPLEHVQVGVDDVVADRLPEDHIAGGDVVLEGLRVSPGDFAVAQLARQDLARVASIDPKTAKAAPEERRRSCAAPRQAQLSCNSRQHGFPYQSAAIFSGSSWCS